jgi:hypothetical protein
VLAPPNPASHRQGAGGEVAGEHAGATGPNFGELDSGNSPDEAVDDNKFWR